MRVLVIPDIHLKPWIFDRAEEILKEGKADRAVCLMDVPDDWGMESNIDRYKETFDRVIIFAALWFLSPNARSWKHSKECSRSGVMRYLFWISHTPRSPMRVTTR